MSDHCPACGEAYYHHRADDFPAYLVIVIVGHLVVPAILLIEAHFAPALWILFSVFLPLTLALTLGLLQPIKRRHRRAAMA